MDEYELIERDYSEVCDESYPPLPPDKEAGSWYIDV